MALTKEVVEDKIEVFNQETWKVVNINTVTRVKKALKLFEFMFLFRISKNLIPLNSILIR